ncbi:MAG: alpha/beta hydrolase family protein [Roseateles sp.]|uniref:alpha/beta hydrolase family protein n=1 Tax=Roseateles sp. TaxID=1971397 RepID=UPI00403706D9
MAVFRIWLLALTMAFPGLPAWAADAAGDWHGLLKTPGRTLRIAVHLERHGDTLVGHVESPDQPPRQLALAEVQQDAGSLAFAVPGLRARYAARWDAQQQRWSGTWTQGPGTVALDLLHGDPPASPRVAGLDGTWTGALDVGTAKLRLELHVFTGRFGTAALLDSPDQMVAGLPVSGVTRAARDVSFDIPAVDGRFEGRLSVDGRTLQGQWRQGAQPLPLTLTHRDQARKIQRARPQHPVRPYPYLEEEVSYANADAGIRLAATLTLPRRPPPHPAVVLISGSGAQDRDQTLVGHKPFLVLADHLTRQGFAVLRFDDRGVGGSTGDPRQATTADFATDAAAGLAFLRTRSDIDARRLGLIGHSEGGLIAPMIAARDPALAAIVLLAAPAGLGADMLLAQQRSIGLSLGQTAAEIDAQEPLMRDLIAAVRGPLDATAAEAAARAVIAALPARQRPVPAIADMLVKRLGSPWMRFFLTHDAAATLAQVRVPVLALNGTRDLQVGATENLAAIRAATASNPKVDTVELPGLNHLFQTAATGAMGEYADIEETFAPAALESISTWLQRHLRPAPR